VISKVTDDLFELERPTLFTKRLKLRPFQLEDARDVQILAGDARISNTTLHIPHPYPDGMAESWIKTHTELWITGKTLIYAVCLKDDNQLIGVVSLAFYSNRINAELAYWVGVPYWNQGYCTEACHCIMNFGFSNMKVNKIKAHHLAENPASGRVMVKNKMVQEGYFCQEVVKRNKLCDVAVYGVTRDNWF